MPAIWDPGPVDGWGTFAVIAGGAAGALVGLLFVAVSIRVAVIAASPELRNRAAQTLGLFVTVLLIALLQAIPDQSLRALGAELLALAAFTVTVLSVLDRRAKAARSHQMIASALDVVTPNTVTSVLVVVASVVLLCNVQAGLYVLAAPIIVALVGGITSTWLLLVRLTD